MIVHGMFVCSSFLISVCMFLVSKALLISSATVIVHAGGAIWLNPFATMFVNCLVKQFALCLSVVVILLLNVMEVFSVVGGVKCGWRC